MQIQTERDPLVERKQRFPSAINVRSFLAPHVPVLSIQRRLNDIVPDGFSDNELRIYARSQSQFPRNISRRDPRITRSNRPDRSFDNVVSQSQNERERVIGSELRSEILQHL